MNHLVHQLAASITALGVTEHTQGHLSSPPRGFAALGVGVGTGAVALALPAAATDTTSPVRAVVRFGFIRAQDPPSAILPKRDQENQDGDQGEGQAVNEVLARVMDMETKMER